MFLQKNHKYLQQQWKLQKNFKNKFFQKLCIFQNNFYQKLFLSKTVFLKITKITILTQYRIKVDYFKYHILKIKPKKLSTLLNEVADNFILNVNLKALNILI